VQALECVAHCTVSSRRTARHRTARARRGVALLAHGTASHCSRTARRRTARARRDVALLAHRTRPTRCTAPHGALHASPHSQSAGCVAFGAGGDPMSEALGAHRREPLQPSPTKSAPQAAEFGEAPAPSAIHPAAPLFPRRCSRDVVTRDVVTATLSPRRCHRDVVTATRSEPSAFARHEDSPVFLLAAAARIFA